MTVVSCNDGSPLTTVGVLVKAGSRFETYDTLGTSHALVNSVGLATKRHTAFGVTRNVQQMGTQLAAKKGREYLTFRYLNLVPTYLIPSTIFVGKDHYSHL